MLTEMIVRYSFTTERLGAIEWHAAEQAGLVDDLPGVVAGMLTEPVTRWLPPSWQGPYTHARAAEWIADRDAEGPVLLVVSQKSGRPVGLVLLFEEPTDGGVDVRLGHLLAEAAWGQGFGGELLGGFVAWCRSRPEVQSIIGGVARENTASIRLLERHGFVADDRSGAELMYRLSIS
jgi:RimJ/RimL family protein N-acetyltransferase